MIDTDESFTLVDSRPAHKFEAWRLPDAVSFPFGARESLDEAQLATFRDIAAPDEPVVTVCGKGVRCVHLAVELAGAGYEHLKTVSDGMWGYLDLYETATATLDEDYRVVQFQRRGKGCLSYLVGSQRTGEAVVIDPTRHTDQYLATAAEHGLEVTATIDTHVHDDHLSGGRAFADRLDVPYYLGVTPEREAAIAHERLEDGMVLPLGDESLTATALPGHTSGHVGLRLGDLALFTGDAVSLDSIGRIGALTDGDPEAAVTAAHRTLNTVIGELPGELSVFPAHVHRAGGRWRTGHPGTLASASLGSLRDQLDPYGLDAEAFEAWVRPVTTESPAGHETIVEANRDGRAVSPATATRIESGPNGNIL